MEARFDRCAWKSELGLNEDDIILLPYQQAAKQTAQMMTEFSLKN